MEFKQLQSFVAVVDYGSFTRASEKLFISQPTISTHIRQLEEEFQSCLLVRTTKSIELTPRGQEFYECAVSILSLKNHLIESWINESRNVILQLLLPYFLSPICSWHAPVTVHACGQSALSLPEASAPWPVPYLHSRPDGHALCRWPLKSSPALHTNTSDQSH